MRARAIVRIKRRRLEIRDIVQDIFQGIGLLDPALVNQGTFHVDPGPYIFLTILL